MWKQRHTEKKKKQEAKKKRKRRKWDVKISLLDLSHFHRAACLRPDVTNEGSSLALIARQP